MPEEHAMAVSMCNEVKDMKEEKEEKEDIGMYGHDPTWYDVELSNLLHY
jgi:hypothetical protein